MKSTARNFLLVLCLLCLGSRSFATIYDWTGATSTDWSNPANWKSTSGGVITSPAATYPGSADTARIGVIALTNTSNFPVISAGGATSVGNIVWGTENYLNVSLAVNTSFTVNGNIENTATVSGNGNVSAYVFNLSGTGTLIVTGALVIGYDDGFTPLNPGNNNTFTFNSTLNQFTVLGGVNLNAYQGDTHHRGFLPSLNISGGTMTTPAIQSTLVNSNVYNSTLAASVTVGNSGGTPTATLQLTGANALPTFSPYIVNTLTFNNPGATVEYSGTTSQTVYTDASVANLANTISYYNLKFSGTGVKTASGGNLNVAGDFTNTLANDASNYLSLSALGAPSGNAVDFNGTTQNLQGGGGNGTTFYNVNFQNSGTKTMSSGTFSVADVGVLTMSGTNTQLAAGNQILTLLSDATSTATVAAIPLGCSITGTVNVQRFVHGSPADASMRGYRLVSSTVYTGTVGGSNVSDVSWWINGTIVTGPPGSGFDPSPLNNPSTYIYREDVAFSNVNFTTGNYKGINKINNSPVYLIGTQKRLTLAEVADTTVTIPVGNGTLFFFRGNKTTPNGTTNGTKTTAPFNYPENVTFTNTGTLNTGTVNVKLWYKQDNYLGYTNSASLANSNIRGFNLLGNPYASTINWEKFNRNITPSKSSIYGSGFTVPATMWMYNPTNKQYEPYIQKAGSISTADTTTNVDPGTAVGCATNMIASGQGFFVRATSATQTFSFRETAKTNTQPSTPKLSIFMGMPVGSPVAGEPLLRLLMIKDAKNTDEILIRLNDTSSTAFSPVDDAEDLGGSSDVQLGLSSISRDNIKLAIDSRSLPQKSPQVIPLYIDAAAAGTYQLKLTQLSDLPQAYQVILRDRYLGDSVIIHAGTSYSFNIDKSDSSTFAGKRFQLVISLAPQKQLKLIAFGADKAQGGALVTWKVQNEYTTTAFYVERSTDKGKSFLPVGSLQSNNNGSYNIVDKSPVKGENQYRLKLLDIGDNISYSNVATLLYATVPVSALNVSVYPNPAASSISLSVAREQKFSSFKIDPYDIKIVNSSGEVVKTGSSQQESWNASIGDLQPGTYVVQVTNSSNKSLIGITSFVKD